LLDDSGLELLHSDVISVEQMSAERIDNTTVYFGQYNFTGLELDKNYIPSVIAVERALDGRCLCPVHGTDPYDNSVLCSCIAADWKPVRLQSKDSQGLEEFILLLSEINAGGPIVMNSTAPIVTIDQEDSSGW
jgi:hypothetical protein